MRTENEKNTEISAVNFKPCPADGVAGHGEQEAEVPLGWRPRGEETQGERTVGRDERVIVSDVAARAERVVDIPGGEGSVGK